MKHSKTVEVPARTETVTASVTCDLCGKVISRQRGNAEIVEIRHRTGSSYPEGGSGVDFEVDMCPDCFDSKLVPWLQSQGAEIRETNWDF
jgi:ribosomal protein S27E